MSGNFKNRNRRVEQQGRSCKHWRNAKWAMRWASGANRIMTKRKKMRLYLLKSTATMNDQNTNLIRKTSRGHFLWETWNYLITTWAKFAPLNFALLIAVHVIHMISTCIECRWKGEPAVNTRCTAIIAKGSCALPLFAKWHNYTVILGDFRG